jgi:hypothetical protein
MRVEFDATNSINFTHTLGVQPVTVVQDLSSNTAWTSDTIKRLRFDPLSSASKVRVHSIRLLR